jgi:hypothetical protein
VAHTLLAAMLAVSAAAGAAAQAPAGPSGDSLEQRRADLARDLLRLGEELRREILAGNDRALAARVPPDGLRCAGRLVPRARVQRDLATPGSWLHDTLLGGPGAPAARSATPSSVAELLRASPEVAIAVTFVQDPRAMPLGRPCLEYRAKGVTAPGAPLCFERREGKWWFTESLYPCG